MKLSSLTTALAVIGLSACSTLDGKSPHEMVSHSIERSLTKDYSYNFQGEIKVAFTPFDKGYAPEPAAKEKAAADLAAGLEAVSEAASEAEAEAEFEAEAETNAASAVNAAEFAADYTEPEEAAGSEYSDGTDSENNGDDYRAAAFVMNTITPSLLTAMPSSSNNIGRKAADYLYERPAIARYLENARIKYSGALDLRRKKLELTPEFSLVNRNESTRISMPMLLDGEEMSIIVDLPASIPAALNLIAPPALRERLIHEPIYLKLSDVDELISDSSKEIQDSPKNYPLKTAVKAMFIAAYRAYADIPPQYYRSLPPDEYTKQAGGTYRIHYLMDNEFEKRLTQAMKKHFSQEFNRLQKEKPETAVSKEKYEQTKKLLLGVFDSLNDTVRLNGIVGMPISSDWYLDKKGRLVGMRHYVQINGELQALNIDSVLYMNRFGKPVFTFNPDKTKTIGLMDIIKAFKGDSDDINDEKTADIPDSEEQEPYKIYEHIER